LTLRDSETVIIGGLINDTEQRSLRKVPGLGDFPAIGSMFSNRDDQETKRDVLMVITPVVIRSQEIPSADATEVWSGSEDRWSLEAPYNSREEPPLRVTPEEGIRELIPEDEPEPLPAADSVPRPPPQADAGNDAPVEAPPPPAAAQPEVLSAAPAANAPYGTTWPAAAQYSIHVGSYIDRVEAEKRVRQLTSLDYECFMIPARIPQKGFFHRIFVGSYTSKARAGDVCNQLRERREFSRDIHVVDRQWAIGS
jgi:cell division septation protein DedD